MTNKKLNRCERSFWNKTFSDWKVKNSYIFASETCALDIVGATFVREVENGEIIIIENNN